MAHGLDDTEVSMHCIYIMIVASQINRIVCVDHMHIASCAAAQVSVSCVYVDATA